MNVWYIKTAALCGGGYSIAAARMPAARLREKRKHNTQQDQQKTHTKFTLLSNHNRSLLGQQPMSAASLKRAL